MAQPSTKVYDLIRSRIMSGTYAPGQHLVETEISQELNVSRSPVRMALKRLTQESLVTTESNRGSFVAQWTRSDINEVFDLRQMLESRAASLAAQSATAEEIARLQSLVDEMAELAQRRAEGYRDDLHHNNQAFHLLIVSAARSPRLFQFVSTLTDTSLTLGTYFYYSDADIDRSVHFHQDLANAIASRNSAAAEALMAAHLCLAHTAFETSRFGNDEQSA
ncbi:MAG: DNA-binding transcriptional regulator, GntR family [Pseudarthrobacter sp.]|nr:DNA-binding transcriptional regulator, GntR family [Pseudarthrobacter sp.]